MVSEDDAGLSAGGMVSVEGSLFEEMRQATDTRLFKIIDALRENAGIEELYRITDIDPWFLKQLEYIVKIEKDVKALAYQQSVQRTLPLTECLENIFHSFSHDQWKSWKKHGFGDEQLAKLVIQEIFVKERNFSKLEMNQAMQVVRKIRLEKRYRPSQKENRYLCS